LLYEVYDPSHAGATAAADTSDAKPAPKPSKDTKGAPNAPVRVLTSIEFLNGTTKVYETPLVEAKELNTPQRHAVAFQFDVPLAQLKPGLYTCQVNVIDDAGGSFTFPRTAMLVRDAQTAPAAPTTPGAPTATVPSPSPSR
jgi:hypothetical protein